MALGRQKLVILALKIPDQSRAFVADGIDGWVLVLAITCITLQCVAHVDARTSGIDLSSTKPFVLVNTLAQGTFAPDTIYLLALSVHTVPVTSLGTLSVACGLVETQCRLLEYRKRSCVSCSVQGTRILYSYWMLVCFIRRSLYE